MLGSKYTKAWADSHMDNSSERVNRKLVALLDVRPPPYQMVLKKMREIAKLYGFNWKPKVVFTAAGDDSALLHHAHRHF